MFGAVLPPATEARTGCARASNEAEALSLVDAAGTPAAACTPSIAPLLKRANRSAAPIPIAALGAAAIAACPLLATALLAFVKDV